MASDTSQDSAAFPAAPAASVSSRLAPSARPSSRVVTCYDLLDLTNEVLDGGIEDYTDGMYFGDPATPYEVAQRNQANWLLDQAGCRPGSRLLDIGCGNGRLLFAARERGAEAVGITVSPQQVFRCRRKGLDGRLSDYRALDERYEGRFDAVVANGSAEHFVQPEQAAAGQADEIYREMFAICHRLLDPASTSGRLVTTVIHFRRVRLDPQDMVLGPFHFRWGSDQFHYAMLVHNFGGFYPVEGQLERCAAGTFRLVGQEDGTWDYHLTSEYWLSRLKRSLASSPRFHLRLARKLARHPVQLPRMLLCLLLAQSWNWQFRGADPPMCLLRQTWQRV